MTETFPCNNATPYSNSSCVPRPLRSPSPYAQFFEVAFGSAIYMTVVAFITVLANSLLLLVFCVDPYKTFRNPTSFFLIGLAFVDLTTGLVQEPIFASCFILGYLKHPAAARHCPELLKWGRILSLTTMNASFITVFAFTATQLAVIRSPLKCATLVTKTRVISVILIIYAYSVLFSLLNLVNFFDTDVLSQVDLFLHSFFVVYVTIAIYILLYKDFRRKMTLSKSLRSETLSQASEDRLRRTPVERRFIAVNFLLISLVFFCSQPSALLALAKHYWLGSDNQEVLVPSLIVDDILYSKFMMDPFVYAWRLPKYRQALEKVMCSRGKKNRRPSSELARQAKARMTKSTESVVTLSFSHIQE